MGKDLRTSPDPAGRAASSSPENEPRDAQSSGRVVFDSRGDAQWQWRQETGSLRPEASTTRVQKLQTTELTLEPTVKVPAVQPAVVVETERSGGGFNPYDRGALTDPKEKAPVVPRTKFPPLAAPPVDNGLSARVRRWLNSRR